MISLAGSLVPFNHRPSQMRKIAVLHIIEQLGIGGAERQLLGMLQRFDHDRFAHSVCYYSRLPDSMDDMFRACGVPVLFVDKHGMSPWSFFRELRRVIKRISPDIVHTWMYSANFWGRWAAVTCGVKRIIASERSEVRSSHIIERWSERLLRQRTQWLANSRLGALSMERYLGIAADSVRIVPNAVELPMCDRTAARHEIREELGLSDAMMLVVMVARIRPEKNYPMFVRVASRVCQRRADVVFVGIGAVDQLVELKPLIESLDMTDRVRFTGERHDVHRWLAAGDVFCFTTNYEGFPNAILEAMLAGLPIVTTAFASVGEILPGPEYGVTVPLNDDERMAAEIVHLLDDPGLRSQLGQAAQAFVRDRFTWAKLVETMEQLYSDLLTGRTT